MRTSGMAELFYEMCAEDWNVGFGVRVGSMIRELLQGADNAPRKSDIFDIIHFGWETPLLVDSWVEDDKPDETKRRIPRRTEKVRVQL